MSFRSRLRDGWYSAPRCAFAYESGRLCVLPAEHLGSHSLMPKKGTFLTGPHSMLIEQPRDISMRLAAAFREARNQRGLPIVLSCAEVAAFLPEFLEPPMVISVAVAVEDGNSEILDATYRELRITDNWGSCPRFERGKWAL